MPVLIPVVVSPVPDEVDSVPAVLSVPLPTVVDVLGSSVVEGELSLPALSVIDVVGGAPLSSLLSAPEAGPVASVPALSPNGVGDVPVQPSGATARAATINHDGEKLDLHTTTRAT
jgi:hypothetical protein